MKKLIWPIDEPEILRVDVSLSLVTSQSPPWAYIQTMIVLLSLSFARALTQGDIPNLAQSGLPGA